MHSSGINNHSYYIRGYISAQKMIIVNFATKQYAAAQKRLKNSVNGHKSVFYTEYSEIDSVSHSEDPYAFKVNAIEKAFELDDIVLWVDSSMYLKGDLSKIENIIKTDGYFMEEAGHYCGRWTNQHARDYFEVTEEEMKQGTGGFLMFSAGLLGINLKSELAMEWFYKWKQSALAGCFRGDWSNHRHDMTCGSIIAQRLGMKYQRGGSHLSYVGPGYSRPEEGSVFYCQGL